MKTPTEEQIISAIHTAIMNEGTLLLPWPDDTWVGVAGGEDWDLNVWTEDGGKRLASLHPVIDGSPNTDITIPIEDKVIKKAWEQYCESISRTG